MSRREEIEEEIEEKRERIEKIEEKKENLTEDDYEEFLDSCYGNVDVCGSPYPAGQVLKEVDPTAFNCGFSDWVSEEEGPMQDEIDDLEEEIKELEEEVNNPEALLKEGRITAKQYTKRMKDEIQRRRPG